MTDDVNDEDGGGVVRKLLFLLLLIGAASYALKRQREQELDEALWEEPQAL